MGMKLDHFAVSSPDLDAAAIHFEQLSGVRPEPGGSHPGQGTRNALVSLGPDIYLALDGPDPEQPLIDNNGARMASQEGSELFLFAVATDDLDHSAKVLSDFGVMTRRIAGSRQTRTGRILAWEYLEAAPSVFGRAMPHIATWKTLNHPAAEAPKGCRLSSFEVFHPEADHVEKLYQALGLDIKVVRHAQIALRLTLNGTKGEFRLE
jgi:hypothetical protein